MEDEFLDEDALPDNDDEPAAPVIPLDMRRVLDDVLEERRLRKQLKDYDFDLDG
ncbi:MAG: hypothetical protein U0998_07795 [Moraxellaceae bacterium]|nr:hypothetical protein [Moraxellaceae bacterium]MDP1539718.1 hypothetical protein [Moraxellaceae bacterium]MDZ4299205.1 hypothetical protein [Moraxellaceae bacterium]MDZ4387097.1 hypothetical protein [Moraxellaceae bacterium]